MYMTWMLIELNIDKPNPNNDYMGIMIKKPVELRCDDGKAEVIIPQIEPAFENQFMEEWCKKLHGRTMQIAAISYRENGSTMIVHDNEYEITLDVSKPIFFDDKGIEITRMS